MSSSTKLIIVLGLFAVIVLLLGVWLSAGTMSPDKCDGLGGVVVKGNNGDWVCISKSAVLK